MPEKLEAHITTNPRDGRKEVTQCAFCENILASGLWLPIGWVKIPTSVKIQERGVCDSDACQHHYYIEVEKAHKKAYNGGTIHPYSL
jgi:hypothetical protein